ncbi:MAG: S46 family peptidase [Myxococcaceae bacterium]|nr:S46 family peptidase [Myxococcaceae bacterium]
MRPLVLLLCLLLVPAARAGEGMWLFTDVPTDRIAKEHGVQLTPDLLTRIRLGAAKLSTGCSSSFVSQRGLVMTNHHCARSCIEDLSTGGKDYLSKGFLARTDAEELRCPGVDVTQLQSIDDVTARIDRATAGKTGAAYAQALKAEKAAVEAECKPGEKRKCEVVTLYNGGRYHLYTYRRLSDVRLVWAPEFHMAAWGGDPDNFNFPRYGLDAAFLRAYEDGKPANVPEALQWAPTPLKAGDFVLVAGHPGGTERLVTMEQLAFQRDTVLPETLLRWAELRGVMLEFKRNNPKLASLVGARVRSVENGLKGLRGRHEALAAPTFFSALKQQEDTLRAKVAASPELSTSTKGAWESIGQALRTYRGFRTEHVLKEEGQAFESELFRHARRLVRAADELPKDSSKRLREYSDASLPALRARVLSPAPIPREMEVLTLSFSLRRMREVLGTDDPFVQRVLAGQSPEARAEALVKGTRLADPKARAALLEGGKAAVEASKDPMVVLAREVDAEARALRQRAETEVDAVVSKASEAIARARFAVQGTSVYPDATGTLRLSWGEVKGWEERGHSVAPLTTFGQAFARATGDFPLALPPTWLKAKGKLDLGVPLDVATTNDIIGGNSGSPLLDREGRVVGLIFDGNLHSLGGRYGYDAQRNRAVAVHGDAIVQALERIYGGGRVLEELRPGRAADAR